MEREREESEERPTGELRGGDTGERARDPSRDSRVRPGDTGVSVSLCKQIEPNSKTHTSGFPGVYAFSTKVRLASRDSRDPTTRLSILGLHI